MDFQQIRKYVKGVLTNSFLNKTTLDKLSTSDAGNLLFDGKEINSGSNGCSNMVDFDNVITTISGAKRIEYTAQENCYLYKQTVTTGSNGNEKITINGNTIGWTIYTDGYTIGGYALIPLKKDDTIIIENTSDETWAWQPVTIYGVVKENILHNYSEDEKVVGKWIDGKPIYEKVIPFTTTLNQSIWVETPELINDKEQMLQTFGISTTSYISLMANIDRNDSAYVRIWNLRNTIFPITHVIMQYTKTTD